MAQRRRQMINFPVSRLDRAMAVPPKKAGFRVSQPLQWNLYIRTEDMRKEGKTKAEIIAALVEIKGAEIAAEGFDALAVCRNTVDYVWTYGWSRFYKPRHKK